MDNKLDSSLLYIILNAKNEILLKFIEWKKSWKMFRASHSLSLSLSIMTENFSQLSQLINYNN